MPLSFAIISQLSIDYRDTSGGTNPMGRFRFGRLASIFVFAAGLTPATAHAQAPKVPAPVPTKAAKAPAAKPSAAKPAKAPKPGPAPAAHDEPATHSIGFNK